MGAVADWSALKEHAAHRTRPGYACKIRVSKGGRERHIDLLLRPKTIVRALFLLRSGGVLTSLDNRGLYFLVMHHA